MPADRPRTRLSFDRLAEVFDDQRGLPPPAVAALHHAFGQLVDGGISTLIEPGAGTGRIAIPALAAGLRVTALDVSAAMLDALRHRLQRLPELTDRCKIVAGEAESLPFDDDSFDAGLLAQVLYLIPDWHRAMDEMVRVVVPGGRVLLVQEHTEMSPALRRWDAAWRAATARAGYRAIAQEPDDPTASAALTDRVEEVTETALASWTFGQTVTQALDGLDRLRLLYNTLADDAWNDAVSSFRDWQANSGLRPQDRLDGEVTLTLVSGVVPRHT